MRRAGSRLAHGLLVLWLVSLLSFLALELAPGDFFDGLRLNPQIPPEALDALRARHGLDRPVWERYLRWLGSLASGELGFSFSYNTPVGPLLWERGANTLLLTGSALILTWALALPLGIIWATRKGTAAQAFSIANAAVLSLPDIVISLLLLLLAVRTGWLPTGGMLSAESIDQAGSLRRAADVGRHMILPVFALVISSLPAVLRHVRSAMSDVLETPYVQAARGLGIPEWRVLTRHALPAAANPLVSLFGLSIAGLLSSSLLVEVVLSWPGLGPLLLEAIFARDFYLVLAPVMAGTLLLLIGNLFADFLLHFIDPRVRHD